MSYAQRNINLTFQIGKGNFGESGFNTVTVSGLRVSAQIQKAPGPTQTAAQVKVYGLTLSLMNQLSTIGHLPGVGYTRNDMRIDAGDAVNGMSTVFIGSITQAWADFGGIPDVSFTAIALTGFIEALKPIAPNSYPGAADAVTILQQLASTMGLAFENKSNASVILANPYFPGTALTQAQRCAHAANLNMAIDSGTMAIWPMGGSRGGTVRLISAGSGMVGFPRYNKAGISLTTEFNPNIACGTQVQVQSIVTPANGIWPVTVLEHDIESQVPDGSWFTTITATIPGITPSGNPSSNGTPP